jgi:hypothetical protein
VKLVFQRQLLRGPRVCTNRRLAVLKLEFKSWCEAPNEPQFEMVRSRQDANLVCRTGSAHDVQYRERRRDSKGWRLTQGTAIHNAQRLRLCVCSSKEKRIQQTKRPMKAHQAANAGA